MRLSLRGRDARCNVVEGDSSLSLAMCACTSNRGLLLILMEDLLFVLMERLLLVLTELLVLMDSWLLSLPEEKVGGANQFL